MDLPTSTSLPVERLQQLRTVAGIGPVLILTHDNPDPDALASGKALAALLQSAWDIPSHLRYSGLVLRAENRALLELLTPEWQPIEQPRDFEQYTAVALVDTQPGAGNNRLPETRQPDIVIDHHHPLRDQLQGVRFVDVEPEIGSTVTLVERLMEAAQVTPDAALATAMFYGLKTDTRALSRGTTERDIAAYLRLLAQIDRAKLIQIEQAGLPAVNFRALYQGLEAARVYSQCVVADLGPMHRPDLPSELADLLIRFDSMRAVLCLGVHERSLYLSVRTRPMGRDAGLLVQKIIVPPGKAGGHGTMAGGQVPLNAGTTPRLVKEITSRFLDVMGETSGGKPLV